MVRLIDRVATLEAHSPGCDECGGEHQKVYMPDEAVPESCTACGRVFEVLAFTIRLDHMNGEAPWLD